MEDMSVEYKESNRTSPKAYVKIKTIRNEGGYFYLYQKKK